MDSLRRYPAADVVVDQARSWLSTVGEEPFFFVATPDGPSSPLLSSGGCAGFDWRHLISRGSGALS